MIIEQKRGVLKWTELEVALFAANKDWYGTPLDEPVGFSFVKDEKFFWFIATHPKAASLHPDSRPNQFTRELWRYDVAEFFLTNQETGRYLEFNLSPNGAWWAAEFSGPREGMGEAPLVGVETYADLGESGRWIAAARFELDLMYDRFNLGPDTTLNATFILNSPEQQFVSVADLGEGEPDFHQPSKFKQVSFVSEDKLKF